MRPPARRVTLHLRAEDGTYGGPIVIGRASDLDGIPSPLAIDDDGDLILDNLDPPDTTRAAASQIETPERVNAGRTATEFERVARRPARVGCRIAVAMLLPAGVEA